MLVLVGLPPYTMYNDLSFKVNVWCHRSFLLARYKFKVFPAEEMKFATMLALQLSLSLTGQLKPPIIDRLPMLPLHVEGF